MVKSTSDSYLQQKSSELVSAVCSGNIVAVQNLFQTFGEDESATICNCRLGREQVSVLQIAAAKGGSHLQIVKLLLKYGADLDLADKLGRTALFNAATLGSTEIVKTLLQSGAQPDGNFKLKLTTSQLGRAVNNGEKAVNPSISLPKENLIYLELPSNVKLPEVDCLGRTPLHQAVKGGHVNCVKLLLSHGASANAQDIIDVTPLLLAGAGITCDKRLLVTRYEEIVNLLVSAGADVNVYNPITKLSALHHSIVLRSTHATQILLDANFNIFKYEGKETVLHTAASVGHEEILGILLKKGCNVLVNATDEVGCTPLHKAAYSSSWGCLMQLIANGGNLAAKSSSGFSVLDAIMTSLPCPQIFLTEVFDNCITCNNAAVNDADFKITVDFGVLCPFKRMAHMDVLSALMASANESLQISLFQHPLIELFMRYKWSKLRNFFLLLVIIQMSFVISLSVYVMMLVDQDFSKKKEMVTNTHKILCVTSSILLVYSLAQLYSLPRHYTRQHETWLNLLSIFLAMIIVFVGEDVLQNYSSGMLPNFIHHIMAIAVLLAWAEIMFVIGRFPMWGYYALMFYKVLINVLKVLMTFVCLVIGFALSFAVQFPTKSEFSNPWKALVKTTVMMMGEFDYGDMFEKTDEESVNNQTTSSTTALPVTSRIIFFLFVVLASIVLMNLMVGLAVSDIQSLLIQGHSLRLIKQADFVAHLEKLAMKCPFKRRIFPKCIRRTFTEVHNKIEIRPIECAKSLPSSLLSKLCDTALESRRKSRLTLQSDDRRDAATRLALISNGSLEEILTMLQRDISEIKSFLQEDRYGSKSMYNTPYKFSKTIDTVHMAQGVLRRFQRHSSGIPSMLRQSNEINSKLLEVPLSNTKYSLTEQKSFGQNI